MQLGLLDNNCIPINKLHACWQVENRHIISTLIIDQSNRSSVLYSENLN